MLEELKKQVYEANMELPRRGLITYTWGNVSGIDREKGLFVIKPSGVEYDLLKPEDMVVIDLNGNKVEGDYNPSSDTPTHLELYKAFPKIGGVVHTHSPWATSWAQAGRSIPGVLCTNHGPVTWGTDAANAVHNAVVLEEVAKMACRTEILNARVQPAPQVIQDKHFLRKHGANAYYGQIKR